MEQARINIHTFITSWGLKVQEETSRQTTEAPQKKNKERKKVDFGKKRKKGKESKEGILRGDEETRRIKERKEEGHRRK